MRGEVILVALDRKMFSRADFRLRTGKGDADVFLPCVESIDACLGKSQIEFRNNVKEPIRQLLRRAMQTAFELPTRPDFHQTYNLLKKLHALFAKIDDVCEVNQDQVQRFCCYISSTDPSTIGSK